MKQDIRRRLERRIRITCCSSIRLQLGMRVRELARRTGIDPWFISEVGRIAQMETRCAAAHSRPWIATS